MLCCARLFCSCCACAFLCQLSDGPTGQKSACCNNRIALLSAACFHSGAVALHRVQKDTLSRW
jgi:hypothetical protein